jgi:multidrug efflux pump subunit AcrA (membrane-fusion protein)
MLTASADKRLQHEATSAANALAPAAGDDATLWAAFAGARQASEFCRAWLTIQCRSTGGTIAGLLLLEDEGNRYKTAATWPDSDRDLSYLAKAAEQALTQRQGIVLDDTESPQGPARPDSAQVAYPIEVAGHLHGVVVLDVTRRPHAELQGLVRNLHWGMGWLETLFRRREAEESTALVARTTFALDMLAGASEHQRVEAAAAAVVNDLATRLSCRRVSLGLVRRDAVKLMTISHSAIFHEKAHSVGAIENAMEEALDQHAAVVIPDIEETAHQISLTHQDLAKLSGAQSVLSVVMTSAGRDVGVITLERDKGDIFDKRSVDLMEAVAVLLGPVLELKADARRMFAGRAVDGSASALKAVFGPGRPAAKLAAVSLAVALAALALMKGEFRVSAKAVIEGAIQRAAVAPFDGYIATAPVRAGEVVEEGQILATLDDHELALEANRWRSEYAQQVLKYDDALGKHDRSAAGIAQAVSDGAQAQLALVDDKLSHSKILSPFRGIVVSGDLSQMVGSPIEKGKVLFEIAQLEAYRVVLQVDERDISVVSVGQRGQVVLTGLANAAIRFTVKNVTPVATSADNRNYFRVEADVEDPDHLLRPGMEGIGKVSVDERPLLAVWTRSLIDWIRISIWKWWP